MTQRLRARRWLAGAAVAAAALSPAAPAASAASASTARAAAPPPAGRVAAVRFPAPVLPGRAPAAAPKADETDPGADPDPVADVPHEAYEELAGSVAGVGRERPGRPAAEPANPETVLAARPLVPVGPHDRPALPADPALPARPAHPADPAHPVGPGRPDGPGHPVGPGRPVGPGHPVAPGRPDGPASAQPVAPPAPSPPPVVTAIGTGPNERAADLAAHILPLGTGFALMGLGLGYLGMRLRKGL
ncbi:hypothetical protein [Streptomyces sp. NPDC056492]|uniref:hypothetical protein n=1 Tax=unclassified Streptomyces TaxID=2593676 RepID=UPI0036CAF219